MTDLPGVFLLDYSRHGKSLFLRRRVRRKLRNGEFVALSSALGLLSIQTCWFLTSFFLKRKKHDYRAKEIDDETGDTYYVNSVTGEAQWETPADFTEIKRKPSVPSIVKTEKVTAAVEKVRC